MMKKSEPETMIDKLKLTVSWVTWPLTYGVMFLFSFFVKVQVSYEDINSPTLKRPLIIISNHRSIYDPWFISFAIPFKILFGQIFPLRPYSSLYLSEKNKLGRFLKILGIVKLTYFMYNTISLKHTDSFDEKIAPIITALNKKHSILMFPEGRLISEESILEFKKGVVRIHQLTNAPILPVAIKYDSSSFFPKVYVTVGKPITIPQEFLEKNISSEFRDAREYLREKIVYLYEKTKNLSNI